MSHSHVFVIGAGPAGLTAAYLLTKQGISTTVIEADPLQDGRNMVMMLAPHKEAVAAKPANEAGESEPTTTTEHEPAAEPVSAAQPEQEPIETPATPA